VEALAQLKTEATQAIEESGNLESLDQVRVAYLGKKGSIQAKMKQLGGMEPEQRKTYGAELNRLKTEVANLIEVSKSALEIAALNERLATESVDVTLPVREEKKGSIHPVTQVMEECTEILANQGFELVVGPQIEDDFHNFTALNIPPEHPARQMHDTFYFEEDENGDRAVLRTHTSSVQVRHMMNDKTELPYRVIAPGRTYRCDSDVTHSPMFHQIEGLYIDQNITMAQLKGCLVNFVQQFFGVEDVPVRFRPSFFPFTEPSAEMDIGCTRKNGEFAIGNDGWMEILGCGMVHPNVLKNVGVDPEKYQGFAFGIGLERLAMLKYGIGDLRTFYDADVRWLEKYNFAPLDIPTLTGGLTR
jgi:phenylalanyl-tRNA synthetase alpha chain